MEKSQTRFHRRLPAVALATLIAALLLVFVLVGLVSADTTINLNQDVSPPNAIKIGVGVEHYWWDITHDSYPDFWTVEIWDPSANTVKCEFFDETGNSGASDDPLLVAEYAICSARADFTYYNMGTLGPGASISGTSSWLPPMGSVQGRYQVWMGYWSIEGGSDYEKQAASTFWIADDTGDMSLLKFHDVNGDGTQNIGETGLATWTLHFDVPAPWNAGYNRLTLSDGTYVITSVPAAPDYSFYEVVKGGWSRTTPIVSPMTMAITSTQWTTATFGNIQKSSMACKLLHTNDFITYTTGSFITYTLSYTKTGADEGVSPIVKLYFTPAILQWDSDTSGQTPAGSGSSASPYVWTFSNMSTLTQTNSFDVRLHFTSDPGASGRITATSTVSNTYLANPTTNTCSDPQGYTPNAITLSTLGVQSGNHADSSLLFTSALAVVGLVLLALRRYWERATSAFSR